MTMAANILWAHLLRKDAASTTTDTPSQIPPIAPVDRSGTSMRMLMHDTQANLEKFSTRLDGLLQRVEECKAHVVNANKLLDAERDRVLAEVLEIANRCQTELKTHVGTPAQAHELELVRVSQASTDKAVQALEKRIDALQVLFQTQANTMQSLQDQQNNILGAVLPLVPLIQGVPSQIDQIKSALSDMVSNAVFNAVSSITTNMENIKTTLVHEMAQAHEKRIVRSSTHSGHTSLSKIRPGSLRKRPASTTHDLDNIPHSSPLAGRSPSQLSSRKRPRVDGTTPRAENIQLPRKLSRLDIRPIAQPDSSVLRTPRTPRQPLVDLIPPKFPGSVHTRTDDSVRGNSNTASHPPLDGNTVTGAGPAIPELPTLVGRSDADANSKAIKIEEILVPNFSGIISINSSPLSSPPSSMPQRHFDLLTTRTNATHHLPQAPTDMNHGIELLAAQPSPNPLSSNAVAVAVADGSPPKSMSLRDRRAQMTQVGRTERRRFIPLVPWSDEED